MVTSARRASSRLPSHHIDAIDEAVAQLRGLFATIGSMGPFPSERSVQAGDVLNLCWLIEARVESIDHHAQALWKEHTSKKEARDE
jgi:hypothetical protein